MNVDFSKLEAEIKANNMTLAEYTKSINIDLSTYYRRKERGGVNFTVGDMHKTAEVLKLSLDKLIAIFLFDNSHLCETA